MTLWNLHQKINQLLLGRDSPGDKLVEAFVIMPDEPKRVIKLGLRQMLQDESGTYFQLEYNGTEDGTNGNDHPAFKESSG